MTMRRGLRARARWHSWSSRRLPSRPRPERQGSLAVQVPAEPPVSTSRRAPPRPSPPSFTTTSRKAWSRWTGTASSCRGSRSAGTRRTARTTRSSSRRACASTTGASSGPPTSSSSSSGPPIRRPSTPSRSATRSSARSSSRTTTPSASPSRRSTPTSSGDGAAGLGHLSARGGGDAQERAHGHGPLHGRRLGARRPDRAGEEQGLLRQGPAASRQGDASASSPIPTRRWPPSSRATSTSRPSASVPRTSMDLKKDPRFQVILGDTTNDVILAHEQLEEALLRQARAPGHHARDQQGGGAQGRDVRPRPRPRLERGPAQSLLRGHVQGRAL